MPVKSFTTTPMKAYRKTFKNKWLSKSERSDLIEYGIGTQNLRKLTSKNDSGTSSGDTAKVRDALMFKVFGTKLRIKLCKILKNIGLLVPNSMMNNLVYNIALPESMDVLVKQTGQVAAEYSLENLELEYETMMNEDLASEISSIFSQGKSLIYEHVTMFKRITWPKANPIQNINVNVPRKSMRAIVLLFKDDTADHEVFPCLNIDSKISIEGKPNQINSRDLK